ncbi:hypothetical protein D3C86_1719540 [compost metagenome]
MGPLIGPARRATLIAAGVEHRQTYAPVRRGQMLDSACPTDACAEILIFNALRRAKRRDGERLESL